MKLSIITINYNNAKGLQKTLASTANQTCKDFEQIVIDGSSNDGSVEIIRQYSHVTYWVSESDTGIYNAMNKGVRAAKGEYLLMLNSGDFLVDEHIVERIIPELDGTDIIQGNIICDYPDASYRNRGYGKSDITFFDAMDSNFLHQASFIRRGLHDEYGLYDDSYKKNADTYFYRKVLGFGNATFRYADIDIANFDVHGISSDKKWNTIGKEENERWYRESFPVRLQKLYKETPKKIKLYDNLHKNKSIWYVAMFLVRLARLFGLSHKNITTEKI